MAAQKEKVKKTSPAPIKMPAAWTTSSKPQGSTEDTNRTSAAPLDIDVTQTPSDSTARTVNLKVNGRHYRFQVEPNWPLRDVLRQKLGLTSVKDFCSGYGACGSCTVIMNGRPVLSCMILAIECSGAEIETAEGIADAGHPLVEAYIMNWTAQCGYCTPGFIVTAKALLDHNNNPTIEEIKETLAGNLCRCGTYPVHIKAIQEAARKLRGE
jgi:aerobic-type carbon monoxide dehydrogenase small subunit (CoxS/CutS family)